MNNCTLRQAAEDYLFLRRSFGYQLKDYDRPLADFVEYLDRAGLDTVTVDAAVAWALQPVSASPLRHYQRLSIARGFATYLHALDPRCEVPARRLLPEGRRRIPPHIYTCEQIADLIVQARTLGPPLRALTLETMISLLAVTGMRSGEALRLDRSHLDLEAGRLSVVATKYDKSRVLALHASAVQALQSYAGLRDQHWPQPQTAGFFVSGTGRRLSRSSFNNTFADLVGRAGLEPSPGSRRRRPRPHDLRHSFAVSTLLGWHREGRDVQALLPALSAQLGHVDPASTYWYLTAVPELMQIASQRATAARGASR